MAPKKSFLDKSAAQKLINPAIRRAVEFQELSARIEKAQAESVGFGAVPAHLDIDEIRRQVQENDRIITSLQQDLLIQDDQRLKRQDMQRQLDNVLAGLNTQGELPAVARSKAQIQAQRMACLQFLADTMTDATPQEEANFPGLVAAAQEPEKLVPGDKYTGEHIMWALDSDTAKDSWTIDEVFEALVSARRTADQQGQHTVDSKFAIISSTLQRIDTTGQETAKETRRLENSMQKVVDALGPFDDGALIARPSTAPPTVTATTYTHTVPSSFNQITSDES
ncbi:hypothetical protein KCU95_g16809, partial [Aureobasidium melanogenum]